jgi:hypothetical protein
MPDGGSPVTLILILVLANRRSPLGAAANGPLARWVGGISIVSVAAVASFYVIDTILEFVGVGEDAWALLGMNR